ncbi:MAG: hypothetical protein MHM6MM_001328 [Cercozoa sp. M6MM]
MLARVVRRSRPAICRFVSSATDYDVTYDSYINDSRTGVTRQMWEARKQRLAQVGTDDPAHPEAQNLPLPPTEPRKASDSSAIVKLPFGSNLAMRNSYARFDGGIRFGRLLEDLDAMAGNICFEHVAPADCTQKVLIPTMVTAAVDRIDMRRAFPMDTDLVVEGNVSWTGRSSMNVRMQIHPENDADDIITEAHFLMVALDPRTGTSTPVGPVVPSTEAEKRAFARGKRDQKQRIELKEKSLSHAMPLRDEAKLLHDFFAQRQAQRNVRRDDPQALRQALKCTAQGPAIRMDLTKMQSTEICMPQERNMANKIFGGFLMRRAFELARCAAYQFCPQTPSLLAVDDVTFLRPVEIGSMLCFDAEVVYSSAQACQIQVSTRIMDLTSNVHKKQSVLSNVFSFTFGCETSEMPLVLPETYDEAMSWVEGRRSLLRARNQAFEGDASYDVLRFFD